MIKESTYYELYCDRCGEQLVDGDITAQKDKDVLGYIAHESGWQVIDGKWYCPDCLDVDEEGNYVQKKGGEK